MLYNNMFGLLDTDKYFEAYLADGGKYLFDRNRRCIVKTADTVQHGDWKTNSVHPRDPIPVNTEVEVIDHFYNFYGHYLVVAYDDTTYDINSNSLYYVRMETE